MRSTPAVIGIALVAMIYAAPSGAQTLLARADLTKITAGETVGEEAPARRFADAAGARIRLPLIFEERETCARLAKGRFARLVLSIKDFGGQITPPSHYRIDLAIMGGQTKAITAGYLNFFDVKPSDRKAVSFDLEPQVVTRLMRATGSQVSNCALEVIFQRQNGSTPRDHVKIHTVELWAD